MFEHSGHQVFFEEPTKFAEVVLGWVSASDIPTTLEKFKERRHNTFEVL
jgi:hypothetical protein